MSKPVITKDIVSIPVTVEEYDHKGNKTYIVYSTDEVYSGIIGHGKTIDSAKEKYITLLKAKVIILERMNKKYSRLAIFKGVFSNRKGYTHIWFTIIGFGLIINIRFKPSKIRTKVGINIGPVRIFGLNEWKIKK